MKKGALTDLSLILTTDQILSPLTRLKAKQNRVHITGETASASVRGKCVRGPASGSQGRPGVGIGHSVSLQGRLCHALSGKTKHYISNQKGF